VIRSPTPTRFGSLLAIVAFSCITGMVIAQTPPAEPSPTPLPPGYSEETRRTYTAGLKEARELIAERRFVEALAKLEMLNTMRPREPQARFLRAVVLADQGKTDDAIGAYRGLIADFPELPEPHNNLAVLFAQRGEYALARAELELALATAPDYAIAHENLGDVFVRLAADQYERAGKLDRTNQTAPVKLKLVREVLANPKAAAN
jgi:Flp pilus assembly protein TadD